MKFIIVLMLSVITTVTVGLLAKKTNDTSPRELISPLSQENISTTTTPEVKNHDTSVLGWSAFNNNYYGYQISYPSSVEIKNKRDGDVSFEKQNSINIFITQDVLSENETINTVMEKTIDKRKSEIKDKYTLINNISPIALSSVTAQTYTSNENGKEITYYYIPQRDRRYLIVTNQTLNRGSADYLISENIIYSLEFLP